MKNPGIKAILFDLDDTLYHELDFFRGGFEVVGEHLERRGVGEHRKTAQRLLFLHQQEGRDHVLQKLAVRLGFPTEWIPDLVAAFQSHQPRIVLPPDSLAVLPRLRARYRLGCVTDGWAAVQRRKIQALKVQSLLDGIVVADELGRDYWKPHPLPFQKCCELLQVIPTEALFVGDNPDRDGAGARNAGIKFVRMRRPSSYFERADMPGAAGDLAAEVTNLEDLERWMVEVERESADHA